MKKPSRSMSNGRTMTFLEAIFSGRAKLDDIHGFVERWHGYHDEKLDLPSALGLTSEEYGRWARDPKSLATIVESHVPPEIHEWIKFVQSSSIPLVKLDAQKNPNGSASGCLIEYRGTRLLLSVYHATTTSNDWVIRLNYRPELDDTEVLLLPPFYNISPVFSDGRYGEPFDFSFLEVQLDFEPQFQNRDLSGRIVEQRPRAIFQTTFEELPSEGEFYAFAGEIRPEFISDRMAMVVEHSVYPGLTFLRTDGVFHYFKLPMPHPGHSAFKGCSGAPIVNFKRSVVALLCGGDVKKNEVWGIAPAVFKHAIDGTISKKAS